MDVPDSVDRFLEYQLEGRTRTLTDPSGTLAAEVMEDQVEAWEEILAKAVAYDNIMVELDKRSAAYDRTLAELEGRSEDD